MACGYMPQCSPTKCKCMRLVQLGGESVCSLCSFPCPCLLFCYVRQSMYSVLLCMPVSTRSFCRQVGDQHTATSMHESVDFKSHQFHSLHSIMAVLAPDDFAMWLNHLYVRRGAVPLQNSNVEHNSAGRNITFQLNH